MKWYNNLYVGCRKREDGYHDVRMIMQTVGLYDQIDLFFRKEPGIEIETNLSYLPVNENNSLEIYPSYVLLQKHYKKRDLFVVGIGEGRDEALELMEQIIMDCYHKTGQFLVRKMIEKE